MLWRIAAVFFFVTTLFFGAVSGVQQRSAYKQRADLQGDIYQLQADVDLLTQFLSHFAGGAVKDDVLDVLNQLASVPETSIKKADSTIEVYGVVFTFDAGQRLQSVTPDTSRLRTEWIR